jgi:type VI secretion system protein ImpL
MMGISSREVTYIILAGIGLTSVCALVYLAGPLIVINGWRPLEDYIVRELVILFMVAAFASIMAINWRRRKKASAEIASGIADADKAEDDADVLKDRMKDALTTLKNASGAKADFLYDLPWYVLIGPPGSGKTTALVNSGLKFPLSRGATPAAIAGVGGTRYCDWWFTEEAVLIDTAGRYTTQDSDAKADKQSWFAFLDLLKKNRPKQPINGVLVAISLEDLMTLPAAEIAAHANAIRARLLELHQRLKVDFPVYALFTKGDLVAGFTEFFASQYDQGRRQVWGATFQTADKTRNMVGDIPGEFDLLIERINSELTDRLQEEPTPSNRVLLYGFPTQMAALARPIFDFLNQIFEPTRYHANATLRGFYFTSGTQHGTPIDRLIGALAKSFGAEHASAQAYSGLGKSYFLTDLILKVIIGESAWVSTDVAAVRRARIIRACLYSTVGILAVAMAGLWWTSYTRNRDLISGTQAAVADYERSSGRYAHETVIGDRDLHNVLPLIFKLRNLPTGYATRETATPLLATMGLSQRDRLQVSAEQVYHVALERLFRPRLMFRLEEVLEANKANPGAIYEALKVYLMISGAVKADRDLIVGWMRNDWSEKLYPGAAYAEGRKALEDALTAMLDLEGGDSPLIEPNQRLIEDCQRVLARLSIADRAYQLLKSQSRQAVAPDWLAFRHGGPDFATVFDSGTGDALDSIGVPGFYTYAGFQHSLAEKLPTIADQLQRDSWVLGNVGQQNVIQDQFANLARDILNRYGQDFYAQWTQALQKLRIRPLNAGKPNYEALNAAAASTSPIRLLMESVRDETVLTRERKDPKAGSGDAKKEAPPPLLLDPQGTPAGANIEGRFKPIHVAVEGDGVRVILGDLSQINNTLQMIVLNPAQEQQATGQLRIQVGQFRSHALLMPDPFRAMLLQSANSFEDMVAADTYRGIRDEFQQRVYGPCSKGATGRYPLVRGAREEIPLLEFGKLFGVGGAFDDFFRKNLEQYVDTSQRDWKKRQDNAVGRILSDETVHQFQLAAKIKEAFFSVNPSSPTVILNVTPPFLGAADAAVAKLEINGVAVTSATQPNPPVSQVTWPGPGAGRNAFTLTVPGASLPYEVFPPRGTSPQSPWAFFRLLGEQARLSQGQGGTIATFNANGRDVPFIFATGTNPSANPLRLPALTEFKCPATL